METGRQPGQQAGFGIGEVDTGHADLGESQLTAPGSDLRDELNNIHSHAPIVGSPDATDRHQTVWRDEADTAAWTARLAASPAIGNAVIALHGDLGAGKTTLVRHLLRALGVTGRVKSPTYAIVETYELAREPQAPLAISHFDFYRFDDAREWEDAGFRELFAAPGLKLVEWPEKAHAVMPAPDADIHLDTMTDDTRQVTCIARSATGLRLLEAVRA